MSQRPVQGDHPYKQVITSPDEHENRQGRSLVTTSHETIRDFFHLENPHRDGE